MSVNDAYTDVVELCALLQCLGFSVKSLETSDSNISQDGGTRTVVINCQSSGLHVVLESPGLSCSCPANQNSGVWQVSGVSGGKQLDKEFGCTLLGSLPKAHRERLTTELREMIRCIKQHNESVEADKKTKEINKSTSMIELNTPEKGLFQPKVDTPTMYRSLDTLTAAKVIREQPLPTPGPLTKRLMADAYSNDDANKKAMCGRQSTYTLSSTPPGSARQRNKTSSPIQNQHNTLLEHLIEAEKRAEDLRNKLSFVIMNYVDEGRDDSSMSSLALDVSKISVVKEPAKSQFASSPNLSGLGTVHEDFAKSRLKRFESTSTSSLVKKPTTNEKASRLRRISPNIFKSKKDTVKPESQKPKVPDSKSSKLNSLFRPKIVTPVARPPVESSPNMSASKKKFNHVKSTIPRPTPSKKE